MTRNPFSVGPDAPIEDAAAELARRRIRRLLVIEHDHLRGIVTKTDLLKRPGNELVRAVMTRDVATAVPATPLEVAAKLMIDRKIGALPVIDAGGHVIGILTESDAMRALIAAIAVPGPGVRITFRAGDADAIVRFTVEAARRHHMQVLSVLVAGRDGERRVLVKLTGAHGDAVIDDAWRSGHTVMSALRL